jgi:acyl-CoA reductase-like NAD-dependent aldehyde dehydrogenase
MTVATFEELTRYRWSSEDTADRFPVENPATGKVITVVQGGGIEQVNAAIDAAHRAFSRDWRWRPSAERGRLLLACANVLEEHAGELAEIESLENGKPVVDARQNDIEFLIGVFRFFGSMVDKLPSGDFHDSGAFYSTTVLEPFGVVGAIIPFNWPPIHTGGKIAPALAVGNTVVLKPSEAAPLTVIRIAELCNQVLPPDVLHVVPGNGPAVGQGLAANPLVKMVSFTGSTKAGAAVAATAAGHVAPVLLELGGKNALIVFDDADMERAIRDALEGGFYNKGEACTATSRILVQKRVAETFTIQLAAGVRALKSGAGNDPATHVGPVVTKAQQAKVLNYIKIGKQEGAKVVAEGQLPTDPTLADGFFVRPTLFAEVAPGARVAQEEIFGPVVTVTVFDTEAEAIEITNSSEYGLFAAIYTRDSERYFRMARKLDVGVVLINNYFRGLLGLPFGGTKHSGYGREHTIETLSHFGFRKLIRVPSGVGTWPEWRAVTDIFGQAKAGKTAGQ